MARCNCSGSCGCAVQAGTNVTIGGTGSPANPWVINASLSCTQVRGCLGSSNSVTFNPATGTFAVRLSTDPGNELSFGSDGGVFDAGSTVQVGCGIQGVGTLADPVRARVDAWPFPGNLTTTSTGIYCDPSTGLLRGAPLPRQGSDTQQTIHGPVVIAVPTGAALVVIDNFPFSHTNPDVNRTNRLLVNASVDIEFTLPAAGGTAEFAVNGDRIVALTNPGTVAMTAQRFQVMIPVVDQIVSPGATHNYTIQISGDRGAVGATYTNITVRVNATFVPN